MRFCGGTPAPASLSETNSYLAKKRNESNFLSNNCSRRPVGGAHASHPPSQLRRGKQRSGCRIGARAHYESARTALHDRAAAARTSSGRATKTMIARHDFAILKRVGVDVPQKNRLPIVPLHPELLIEIAVINFTTPADTDRIAAHETFNSGWIEGLDQKLHVLIELIGVPQVSSESADRKIRKRVKAVEHDPEMLLQLSFVIGFKLILR